MSLTIACKPLAEQRHSKNGTCIYRSCANLASDAFTVQYRYDTITAENCNFPKVQNVSQIKKQIADLSICDNKMQHIFTKHTLVEAHPYLCCIPNVQPVSLTGDTEAQGSTYSREFDLPWSSHSRTLKPNWECVPVSVVNGMQLTSIA